MIVKKLSDVSGGAFPGARYNEMKVAAGVGGPKGMGKGGGGGGEGRGGFVCL